MSKKLISNRNLIFKITFFVLLFSIVFILVSSVFIKRQALDNLAEDDAHKTSELIFETMNTRMQEGWGKEDLDKIISRLEHIRIGLDVQSYRSPKVEELFGIIERDTKIVQNDTLIQKAMAGEKQFLIKEDGSIRYLYPMKVSSECITCHHNTKVGDVNGVLDISYPPSEIKISLDSMTYYFVIFFVLTMLVILYIFFFIINIKMVKPIVLLNEKILKVSNGDDFSKGISLKTNIKEIKSLQLSFNKLLNTINKYYDKILNNIYFNTLTSLPNFVKLEKDLDNNQKNSLVLISIDDFKTIKSFYGTKVGLDIVKSMAKVLDEKISDKGDLYKLNGELFAVLLNKNVTLNFFDTLIEEIKQYNFTYDDSTIHVTVSLGCVFNEDKNIVDKATLALRNALQENQSIKVFDESILIEDEYSSHITWTKNIEVALRSNNIIPYFQPIKDSKSNEILKYETLARLSKDGEIFTPDKFIEVSKQSKQYSEFTQAMIQNTFEYFKDKDNISFSMNFSIDDIQDTKTVSLLFDYIEKYNIGSRFILELLETEEFVDFEIVNSFIIKLKKYNVKVAIDDFGSGYSNFSYIGNLNVDFLKIDSSLIENVHTNDDSYKVVKNINNFAHDMGLQTIAEMVHCEEIEVVLKELGIDYLQGYHIGKPKDSVL